MHVREAAREVQLVAQYNHARAIQLAEQYQKQYPNFSDHLTGYHLASHLGDYRVSTERGRWS